jgi:hypothetical protein
MHVLPSIGTSQAWAEVAAASEKMTYQTKGELTVSAASTGKSTARVAASDSGFPQYDRLPYELRELILYHYIDVFCRRYAHVQFTYEWAAKHPERNYQELPPICRVSEQLYHEATPIFISRHCWEIETTDTCLWMIGFLDEFTVDNMEIGFNSVRAFDFAYLFNTFHDYRENENPYMNLIGRCSGLRYLTIGSIDVGHVMKSHPEDSGKLILKDVEELINYYGLENIFKCRNLKEIHVRRDSGTTYEHELGERYHDDPAEGRY